MTIRNRGKGDRLDIKAHLFVLINEDVKRAELEDQQTPQQLFVALALVGFLRVVEVNVDLILLRTGRRFGLTDELHGHGFHHGASIQLIFVLAVLGGCHRRPTPPRRNAYSVNVAGVRPRQSRDNLGVGHVFCFCLLSDNSLDTRGFLLPRRAAPPRRGMLRNDA